MFWIILTLSILLFLVAAKSHGRQLRLERELAGYHHVTFGAKNPPFVEHLWRKDRVQYWRAFLLLALLFVMYWVGGRAGGFPPPFLRGNQEAVSLGFLALGLVWNFVLTFILAGILSFLRFMRSLRSAIEYGEGALDPRSDPSWTRKALLGSAGWWSAAFILSAVVVILASRSGL